MSPGPSHAVILDLGNVLAFHDNEKLFREMARLFRSGDALTPPGHEVEAMRARLDGGLWDRVNRGQLPGDALRRELNARLGTAVSEEAWLAVWSCHFSLNEPMVQAVEGLVGQVRLVLLSNTHDLHVAHLRPLLPVLERFDGLVLSCEVGLLKPEVGIYQRALAIADRPKERVIFFDDVERYALAAEQVGITGRVFTTVPRFQDDLAAFLGR